MKWFLTLFSILAFYQTNAQTFTGVVKDLKTHFPIANVRVYTLKESTSTNAKGLFTIEKLMKGESLSLRLMGYETVEFIFGSQVTDTVIFLSPIAISLSELKIEGKRNYKLDSINLRKEYARVFNSKPVKFKDILIKKDPNYKSPFPAFNPNSTASLVSIDVLKVIGLLANQKNQTTKLKSTLLKAEEDNYIDHVFSKDRVSEVTGLSGDSLLIFMNKYRPDVKSLKKMTSYELTLYIRKCFSTTSQ